MSKYDSLTRHLTERRLDRVPMTFPELESVLGFSLPPSARKFRAWWSNNPTNHVNTQAWLEAGYQSQDVDLEAERLVFVKLNRVETEPNDANADHPLWGCLKGTVTIMPGVDLTDPLWPDSDDEMDEAMGSAGTRA